MRSFALVAVSLAALLSVRSAWADHTFACQRPPDREARVAVRDNVAVGWTQDQNSRTCTFSVDGAKAASPPANLILKGFNSLRNGAPVVNELRQKQVDNLAYAMLATAPVSDIPTEFRSALSQNANTLARCLANFFSEGRPPAMEPTEGAAVTCRVAPTTAIVSGNASDYLEIAVTWSDKRYVTGLYIPRTYSKLPPMQ